MKIDHSTTMGHVIAPEGREATLTECYFWALPERFVEKTHKVVIESAYQTAQGPETVRFYAVVDNAVYAEPTSSVHADRERRDEPGREAGPADEEGTAYYLAKILRTERLGAPKGKSAIYVPPLAGSPVRFATNAEIAFAYGYDRMKLEVPVGLIKNGATRHAGPGSFDWAFLGGQNGAHLNAGGISGVATKTTSHQITVMSLMQIAERQRRDYPSAPDNLKPVPVLFSVKGTDMFWLDKKSRIMEERPDLADHWIKMGLEPRPFRTANLLVPGKPSDPLTPRPLVPRGDLRAYSWGLGDIIQRGLLRYLFAADDRENQNFSFMLGMWEDRLTHYRNGYRELRGREFGEGYSEEGTPQTFADLAALFEREMESRDSDRTDSSARMDNAHTATIRSFYRRLKLLQRAGAGVIAWDIPYGCPPAIAPYGEAEVNVIDVTTLSAHPEMQRFVISAVLDQLVEARSHPDADAHGQGCYLVGLDELNRWAPKGSSDATTKLFEKVAGEMRSMRIILFGAQQFASQVSSAVRENASCILIGRTTSGELGHELYRDLSSADKEMIRNFGPGEMLLLSPGAKIPAHVDLPFPAWATRYEEVYEDAMVLMNASPESTGEMYALRGVYPEP